MSGIAEKWREAKTDRERADVVFAFRQQVLKDKTLEEIQKNLGVPTCGSAGGELSGRCVLK